MMMMVMIRVMVPNLDPYPAADFFLRLLIQGPWFVLTPRATVQSLPGSLPGESPDQMDLFFSWEKQNQTWQHMGQLMGTSSNSNTWM